MQGDGIGVIDPRRLPVNNLPPPVHIERMVADRKSYQLNAGLRLPPLIRDLEIDYTALSLVDSEKNRFRYKLEGYDSDWQDVGTRRQAFYTNVGPRNYRFRVTASNNSGVWNEAGVAFDFSVAPATTRPVGSRRRARRRFWHCSGGYTGTGCIKWRASSTRAWKSESASAYVSRANCTILYCRQFRD